MTMENNMNIEHDDEPRNAYEAWHRANVPGVNIQRIGDAYFLQEAVRGALIDPRGYVLCKYPEGYALEEVIEEQIEDPSCDEFDSLVVATDLPEHTVRRLRNAGVRVYNTMEEKWEETTP